MNTRRMEVKHSDPRPAELSFDVLQELAEWIDVSRNRSNVVVNVPSRVGPTLERLLDFRVGSGRDRPGQDRFSSRPIASVRLGIARLLKQYAEPGAEVLVAQYRTFGEIPALCERVVEQCDQL